LKLQECRFLDKNNYLSSRPAPYTVPPLYVCTVQFASLLEYIGFWRFLKFGRTPGYTTIWEISSSANWKWLPIIWHIEIATEYQSSCMAESHVFNRLEYWICNLSPGIERTPWICWHAST
jgi:hypothetical protein